MAEWDSNRVSNSFRHTDARSKDAGVTGLEPTMVGWTCTSEDYDECAARSARCEMPLETMGE